MIGNKGISVAQISTECVPFYKTGGLADVTFELTQELINQGLNVDVILPLFNSLSDRYQENLSHELRSVAVIGKLDVPYDVYRYTKDGIN